MSRLLMVFLSRMYFTFWHFGLEKGSYRAIHLAKASRSHYLAGLAYRGLLCLSQFCMSAEHPSLYMAKNDRSFLLRAYK